MIEFKYIIGANIELFVKANFIPEDRETNSSADVEIIEVKDSKGLDVETDDIVIGGDPLDDLLSIAAMEAHEDPANAWIEMRIPRIQNET